MANAIRFKEYMDKMLGCWNGKNIGGTLGVPFEGYRGVYEFDYYTQDISKPLPNDDLDIQLVWLNAIEKYGRHVDSSILGEYWLSYIIPDWAEYGAGKNNMRAGMVPPLSGYVDNNYRDSCGSFILSEIWACLAPGLPAIATRYAYEDAVVDHSTEGLYAEIFCAAMQSAAFVENDYHKLIDIACSYIPGDCAVVKAVQCVKESHAKGLTWKEARKVLLRTVPGSFGMLNTKRSDIPEDEPVGPMGFDAPSNIGIIIIGMLYGGGDFGKSICIAAGCGEDADCTAGTLGAVLGIIKGNSGIDEKWLTPLGGLIETLCIDKTKTDLWIPRNTDELVDRIARTLPSFLGGEYIDVLDQNFEIKANSLERLFCRPEHVNSWYGRDFHCLLERSPYTVRYNFPLYSVLVNYKEEPYVKNGVTKRIKLTFENHVLYQQGLNIKWYLPEDWQISPCPSVYLNLEQFHCNIGISEIEFTVTPNNLHSSRNDLIIQIVSNGHHTQGLIPIVFFTRAETSVQDGAD